MPCGPAGPHVPRDGFEAATRGLSTVGWGGLSALVWRACCAGARRGPADGIRPHGAPAQQEEASTTEATTTKLGAVPEPIAWRSSMPTRTVANQNGDPGATSIGQGAADDPHDEPTDGGPRRGRARQ